MFQGMERAVAGERKGRARNVQGDESRIPAVPAVDVRGAQLRQRESQLEKLATTGELYSRYAKWCLAEAAAEAARARKDYGEAANNVAETKQLLAVAETWAESINNPATFRLDKELEATKARIASLKQRAEGPPQR